MTRLFAAAVVAIALVSAPGAFAASGTFKGASGHKTTGTATVKKKGNGWVLEIGSDFTFDGAPDPKWAFGDRKVDKGTIFTNLKKNTGAQTYRIPRSIDPSRFSRVYLWCEKFSVPLGIAVLK